MALKKFKTAVLGGGLTGLTIVNLLHSKDVILLEKEKECGGLCRSFQESGYTFDYGGSHIIFSKEADVLDFMKKALRNNICQRRRNTKILYDGKLVKYPFENGLSDLSKKDNFECLLGFLKAYNNHNNKTQPMPTNFMEWMYYTFGSGITNKYLLPYNSKIWKFEPAKMDLTWVGNRIPQPPIEDVIKASIGLESEGYVHQLNFFYPHEGGIQALIKSLEKNVREGIIILKEFNMNNIERRDDLWFISDGINTIICEELISTIPIFSLIHAMKKVPNLIINAVNDLKYNSLITVMVGLNMIHLNDISWLYIPEMACLSHRVSFPSNFSDKVAPSNKSSILAEVTYNESDNIDHMTDEEILLNIIGYLHEKKIIDKQDVEYTKIKRIKYAYVINDLNYQRNIKIIKDYVDRIGIGLVGRFSEWEYYNMDACIRRAMDFVSGSNDDA